MRRPRAWVRLGCGREPGTSPTIVSPALPWDPPSFPHPFLTYKDGQQDDVPWETASEGKETVIK